MFYRDHSLPVSRWHDHGHGHEHRLPKGLEDSLDENDDLGENPLRELPKLGDGLVLYKTRNVRVSRSRLALCRGTMMLHGGHSHNWRPTFGRKRTLCTTAGNEAASRIPGSVFSFPRRSTMHRPSTTYRSRIPRNDSFLSSGVAGRFSPGLEGDTGLVAS